MEILQTIWFALTGVLLAAFLVTGGCDFGAGINILFLRDAKSRIYAAEKILPFWDGNQVWLITAGGALFAAFPPAYAAVLSTMYTPVILLLFSITVRVASIEFFAAAKTERGKSAWARAFAWASLLSVLLIGVALGAIFSGLVLPAQGGFIENFLRLFSPMSVAAAALAILYCAAQGALFTTLCASAQKTQGARWKNYSRNALIALTLGFVCYAAAFFLLAPKGELNRGALVAILAAAYIFLRAAYIFLKRGMFKSALASSSAFALLAVGVHAAAAFPYIVPSAKQGEGMTIYAASSGELTLTVMLWVAAIGVPLAIAYNVFSVRSMFKKGGGEKLY